MTCICGYKDDSEYSPHREYQGTFIEIETNLGTVLTIKNRGFIKLFACPKCHTIKMEKR